MYAQLVYRPSNYGCLMGWDDKRMVNAHLGVRGSETSVLVARSMHVAFVAFRAPLAGRMPSSNHRWSPRVRCGCAHGYAFAVTVLRVDMIAFAPLLIRQPGCSYRSAIRSGYSFDGDTAGIAFEPITGAHCYSCPSRTCFESAASVTRRSISIYILWSFLCMERFSEPQQSLGHNHGSQRRGT